METTLTYLECTRCNQMYDYNVPQFTCVNCGGILFARYNLDRAAKVLSPAKLGNRGASLWRYFEILPIERESNIVTLGELETPVYRFNYFPAEIGVRDLYVKDESVLPTGSFKSRGMTVAVSKAKEFDISIAAAPSAGNAGGALGAYAARAGIRSVIVMPRDTPKLNVYESFLYSSNVQLIDGLINDAGLIIKQGVERHGWYDLSTMKEPCRVEGKKIMGYEIAGQFNWNLPDVIVYPTGGGTGLIGMWKAFEEMEQMGWISEKRPKMVAVQTSGCAPVVNAFQQGSKECKLFENAATFASGLRVPKPFADYLILQVIYESNGIAISVDDDTIRKTMESAARLEGVILCPEGAAALAAVKPLFENKFINENESVLVFNTGSGLKYIEVLQNIVSGKIDNKLT